MRRSSFVSLLPVLAVFAGAPPAAGQLATPTAPAGGAAATGVSPQAADVATDFDGLQVRAMRLVKEPSGDGFRLIVQLTETSDPGRRAALVRPKPVLMDELGNVYEMQSVTGVGICQLRSWDYDADFCSRRQNLTTALKAGLPATVVLTFEPSKDGFSADLAAMAEHIALSARMALYTEDGSRTSVQDVVIPNIVLPQ